MEKIYIYNLTMEVWGNSEVEDMRYAYTKPQPKDNFFHFIYDSTEVFSSLKIEEDENLKSVWSYFIPNITNLITSIRINRNKINSSYISTTKDELNNDVFNIGCEYEYITLLSYGPLTINTGRENSYIETIGKSGKVGISIKEYEVVECNQGTFNKYCREISNDYYKFLNYVLGVFGEVDAIDADGKLIQEANTAPILNELFCLEIKDELDETIIKEKIHPCKISNNNLQKIFDRYSTGSKKTNFSSITDEQKIISYLILSGTASKLEEMHTQCKAFINDELLVKNCTVKKSWDYYGSAFSKMVNKIREVFALQYVDQIEALDQDITDLSSEILYIRNIYKHLDLLPTNMQVYSIVDSGIDSRYFSKQLQLYIDKKLIIVEPVVDIDTLLKLYDSYVKFKQLIYDNIPAGDIIEDTSEDCAFKWTTKKRITIYYAFDDEEPELYIKYSNNKTSSVLGDKCKSIIENYNNLNLDFIYNTYKCVFNASILFNRNLDKIKEKIFNKISSHLYTLLFLLLTIEVINKLKLYDTQFDGVFDDIDEFLYVEIV